MKYLTQFLVFFQILNIILCQDLICQETECDCVDGENYQCPKGTTDVVINVTEKKKLEIDCNRTMNDYNEWFFPKLNLSEIRVLIISNCPDPYAGYGELLAEQFNISNVNTLEIENPYPFIRKLTKKQFEQLNTLTRLRVSAPNLQYEKDFLENVPNLTKLLLYHNDFVEVDIMFNLAPNLITLDLSRNKIAQLKDDLFNGLEKLEILNLYYNRLTTLNGDMLRNVPNLRSLELSFNQIHTIANDTFVNLRNLEYLSLSMNDLTFLPVNLFRNNNKLKGLRLAHNPLRQLDDYFFVDFKELMEINLTNTSLVSLPENLFNGDGNLEQIRLDNNKIAFLSSNVFAPLGNLTYLSLSGNRLEVLPKGIFKSLERLIDLNLSGNRLMHIVNDDMFSKRNRLKALHLNGNRIHLIEDEFHFGEELRLLDLSNNLINYLPFYVFQNYASTNPSGSLTVNLSKNNISFFDLGLFNVSHMRANINLDVSYNSIECTCKNYEFLKFLKSTEERIDFEGIDKLKCKQPELFEGKRFADLKLNWLMCDVKKCPEKCDCKFRIHDKAFLVDCSYRNLTRMPRFALFSYANQTVLNLTGNRLEIVPEIVGNWTEYKNVTVLYLNRNRIIDIEWLPPLIKEVFLDENNFTHLGKGVIDVFKNKTGLKHVLLSRNPWKCDCSNYKFQKFLQLSKIVDSDKIFCENSTILLHDVQDICPSNGIFYVIFSFSSILLVAVCFALYFRFEQELKIWLYAHNLLLWLVTEEELDKDKQYDVFVSYSHKDEEFVVEKLLPELESGPNPYSVCVHYRNWVPGEFISRQLTNSVLNSRRTLVILSNSFVDSVWGKMEFRTAHTEAIREGRARVIVLILGDLNEDLLDDELKVYLKTNTYIKWGDPYFWNKLKYALPHRRNVKNQQKLQNIMLKIEDQFEVNLKNFEQLETPPAEGALKQSR